MNEERAILAGGWRRTDAWWALCYPVYQYIGTVRHELSHAAGAVLQGAHITKLHFLPAFYPGRGLLWGYALYKGGHVDWWTAAAPYLCDVVTFSLFAWICGRALRMPRWLWINCFVLGLVSPFANMAYNYGKIFIGKYSDMDSLLAAHPHPWVHAAFLCALALMGAGIWVTVRRDDRVQRSLSNASA